MTEKIKNRDLSMKDACNYLAMQRKSLDSTLTSGQLNGKQKRFLYNSLFQEHILRGSCNIETALTMAEQDITLFYCMTLANLFRRGLLALTDLEKLASPGLQLLHDPHLFILFTRGLLSREQLLSLTKTQLTALSICQPWLLETPRTRLAIQEALALTRKQINSLREAGLAEQLHAKRMTLSAALTYLQDKSTSSSQKNESTASLSRSLSSPSQWSGSFSISSSSSPGVTNPTRSAFSTYRISSYSLVSTVLRDLPSTVNTYGFEQCSTPNTPVPSGTQVTLHQMIATPLKEIFRPDDMDYTVRLLYAYGEMIHRLRVKDIIRFLDTSTKTECSVFSDFSDGLQSVGGQEMAIAYMQLYINLAEHLTSADFLDVIQPFLSNVFGFFVSDGISFGYDRVLKKCHLIWSLVRSRCAITGTDLLAMRSLAMPLLMESGWGSIEINWTQRSLIAFGRLLCGMDLLDNEAFFDIWSSDFEVEDFNRSDSQHRDYSYFQALLSPFMEFDKTDLLVNAIEKRNELDWQPKAST